MDRTKILIELEGEWNWQSDWSGFEIGYDDIEIVSLYTGYTTDGDDCSWYYDFDNGRILEFWLDKE